MLTLLRGSSGKTVLRVLGRPHGHVRMNYEGRGLHHPSRMNFIQERFRRLTSSWPRPMQAELKRCIASHRIQPLRGGGGSPPHYLLLPNWLLLHYRTKKRRRDSRFLSDVLWGQFCIYLAFRLKDDLLDHETRSGWLVFAADILQLEAARAFMLHFPRDSRFWPMYFDSLASTTHGMVQVDSLQRMRRGSVGALLKEYARVCGIFRVGAAALCIRYSGMRDYRCVVRFWNEMAVASQLLDDLDDVDQDWRRGRYNSIVRIVLGKKLPALAGKGPGLAMVKRELATGGIERIVRMLLRRIDRAEAALNEIRGDVPYPGFRGYRQGIDQMRRAVHRERVRLFFSGINRARKRSSLSV